MKKFFKITLVIILVVLLLGTAGLFFYLRYQAPTYSGEISMYGLNDRVEVYYDARGVPHIYATNEEDAYMALGYVHAQDRLFQMEMIRRVASGRLAEVFGEEQLATDKLFRTLGINEFAEQSAAAYFSSDTAAYQRAALAYLAGINRFVQFGKTPVEFTLLGIPKTAFEPKDVYLAAGFMAFGFAEGFRVDPVLQKLLVEHGPEYLDLFLPRDHPQQAYIPSFKGKETSQKPSNELITAINKAIDAIPIPLFTGSNGWVIGPEKSASGFPILANDTHIGFSQPAVWYEAHLEFPGRSFYGHHIAGIPFGLLGSNRFSGWGLTMFENDDVDFFMEEVSPRDSFQVKGPEGWETMKVREEPILVKGKGEVVLQVRETRHGPIINGILGGVEEEGTLVSLWWALRHTPNQFLEGTYRLNHSQSIAEATQAVQLITSPGLNVMYADRDKNIAWWAVAKLPIRPQHVNPRVFLQGNGQDDYLGVHPFSDNPQAINPPWQYVYSANNQPDSVNGNFYHGYFFPRDRAGKIVQHLKLDKKWTVEMVQQMMLDDQSHVAKEVAESLVLQLRDLGGRKALQLADILEGWQGGHAVSEVGPSVYYQLVSQIIYRALGDELGHTHLKSIINTSVLKTAIPFLISNPDSPWWDDTSTTKKESRADVLDASVEGAWRVLVRNFGERTDDWTWGSMHTLTHPHVVGAVKPLDKIFNVGPFPSPGGNEVINNNMFALDTTGYFKVISGPALRKVVDFVAIEQGTTVSPTGQSGNRWSPHYKDQAEDFVMGHFLPMLMNEEAIKDQAKSVLVLLPKPYL
jgi:penicillin G amidase